jgi:hypothetical protein
VVCGFYGSRQEIGAINRLDEEVAYFPALVMDVRISSLAKLPAGLIGSINKTNLQTSPAQHLGF